MEDDEIIAWCARHIVPLLNRAKAIMSLEQVAGVLMGFAISMAVDARMTDEQILTLANSTIEKKRKTSP